MKVIAKKINNPGCTYLTEGKTYDAEYYNSKGFFIEDDCDITRYCLFNKCTRIKADWTIIGNRAVAVPIDQHTKN